jgi:biotin-(acetyl-CoA carboxylase) ligase
MHFRSPGGCRFRALQLRTRRGPGFISQEQTLALLLGSLDVKLRRVQRAGRELALLAQIRQRAFKVGSQSPRRRSLFGQLSV